MKPLPPEPGTGDAPLPAVSLLGIRVSVVSPAGLLDEMARLLARPGCALINNVNVRACNLAAEQPEFLRILNESAAVFCDGFGVKWGARLLGLRLGPRMTPPDWVDDLFRRGARDGWAFFFVGDTSAVVEEFATRAKQDHPGLRIAGWHHGFFSPGGDEDRALIARLLALQPDIIITGMGMPRQEMWADRAKASLTHGIFLAAGALFRWHTGVEKRAPAWIRALGGEGAWRLVRHPIRHFRRYALGVPAFYLRILRERFRRRNPT